MFTAEYFEREIAGLEAQQAQLIVQLHNVDGAISVLKQQQAALKNEDGIPLDEFVESIMPGATIESIDPVEPPPTLAGAASFDVVIPGEEQESDDED